MKDYLIRRHIDGDVQVTVVPLDGSPTYVLPHLERHSPDGFEYGYGGSGPSDLARSIVGDFMGNDDPEPRIYQAVKKICIAPLDQDEPFHVVTGDRITAILEAHS